MLVVIADDLTGAAELGGLGLKRHLPVEINMQVPAATEAELLVVATDTRSCPEAEAVRETVQVTEAVARLQPALIFKKIDSVLRGHVLAETAAQMRVLGLQRALIVPSNPALGRTIKDGIYYFNGKPIHQSSFAHDPEFPVSSSRVTDMLRAKDTPVHLLRKDQALPASGIIVGEVQTEEDLQAWAAKVDGQTLLVGASGFFTAVLQTLSLPAENNKAPMAPPQLSFQKPSLFVSGTTFGKSRNALKAEKARGGPVSYMPAALANAPFPEQEPLERWKREVLSFLNEHQTALVAIDPDTATGAEASAASLRQKMALAMQKVFAEAPISELLIEGGATASAILRQLGLTRFFPLQELAPGVIRMRTPSGVCITLKPGSYDWPKGVVKGQ
ncbi:four-carbon acid sugar kinase family protein [Paraflavisolibacter sp. H34]|uniref:four-carbon acid sugar kinase family protein n=1 Tax=Huijunlia imazamoxiresistens TaxID=3127457 RepID=UPI00301ADAEE